MKNILVVANDTKLAGIIESSLDNRDAVAKLDLDGATKVKHFNSHAQAASHLADRYGQVNLGKIDDTIIFVDLMLEEMDGLSVVEKFRNQYHQLGIAAFVCTQNLAGPLEELQLKSQAESGGANLVLLAPFNLREIGSCVARLFAASSETNASEEISGELTASTTLSTSEPVRTASH